jgi:chromosome segregation ATPase
MSDPQQVKHLQSLVRDLTTKLDDANFVIERLKTKIEEQDVELMIKTVEISKLSTVQSDLKAECDSLRAQLRTCEDGSDFFNRELQKLKTETARQKTEADEYHRTEMKRLRDELTNDIDADQTDLKSEIDSLRAQLQASQENEEYYRSKLVDC